MNKNTEKLAMEEILPDVTISEFWNMKRGNYDKAAASFEKVCDGGGLRGCVGFGWLEKERGNVETAEVAFIKSLRWGRSFWM